MKKYVVELIVEQVEGTRRKTGSNERGTRGTGSGGGTRGAERGKWS